MTEEPISVAPADSIVALSGKKFFFRLPIDGTKRTAEGNGPLEVTETRDKKLEVSIDLSHWPSSGIGQLRILRLYLNQKEIALLRPSLNPDYEIECIDPHIQSP